MTPKEQMSKHTFCNSANVSTSACFFLQHICAETRFIREKFSQTITSGYLKLLITIAILDEVYELKKSKFAFKAKAKD